jgi:hypothetical protein
MVEKKQRKKIDTFSEILLWCVSFEGRKERKKKNTKTNESFIGFRVFLSSLVSPLKPNTPLV